MRVCLTQDRPRSAYLSLHELHGLSRHLFPHHRVRDEQTHLTPGHGSFDDPLSRLLLPLEPSLRQLPVTTDIRTDELV